MAGSVWLWCSGAFHEGELPKETPSQFTAEPAGEDAQWVGQVRKFFTQSGRRSRQGGEVGYPCFAVDRSFAVILS